MRLMLKAKLARFTSLVMSVLLLMSGMVFLPPVGFVEAQANESPYDITLNWNEITENSSPNTEIGSFTSWDNDHFDMMTGVFELVSGEGDTDNGNFNINGIFLYANESLDYETKSEHSVRVRVTDVGGLTFEKQFTILVQDQAIEFNFSNVAVSNIAAESAVISFDSDLFGPAVYYGMWVRKATDPAPEFSFFTYDADLWTMGNTQQISFPTSSDLLPNTAYKVYIAGYHPSYYIQSRPLVVEFTTSSPLTFSFSNVSVTDIGVQSATISFDSNMVSDVGNGNYVSYEVWLRKATEPIPDFSPGTCNEILFGNSNSISYSIQPILQSNTAHKAYIIAIHDNTNSGVRTVSEPLVIDFATANEVPRHLHIYPFWVDENAAANAEVGTLNSYDPDEEGTPTYSLESGVGDMDNSSFYIIGNTLRANESFDYEMKSYYSVRVRVTDSGGQTLEMPILIEIIDVNEGPTELSLSATSIAENKGGNATVGTFSVTDPDLTESPNYELVSGIGSNHNNRFNIQGNTLRAKNNFDFEDQSTYSIRVRVTDKGGLTFEQRFEITVTNVNEAPSNLALSSTTIVENTPAEYRIGDFSSVDPDQMDSSTYELVSGQGDTDNDSFEIAQVATEYTLKSKKSFDFEMKSNYSVRVRVTDGGGLTYEKQFEILVLNVEDATPSTPTGLTATKVTYNSISLSWSPATDDIAVDGYNVFRNGLYVASTRATSYTISGLIPLSTHNITLQAYDLARNKSARSTALFATTIALPELEAPSVPTNLTFSNLTGTSVVVRWDASTDNVGVTGYNVFVNGVYNKTVTTRATTITGLTGSTAYLISIQAVDAVKNRSARSTALSVTTLDSTKPSAPTNVASSKVTKTGARVTWTAATDNVAVTFYNIYRNGAYVATVSGTTTTYNLTALTAGTSYNITVRALDAAKNFTNSAPLGVTTLP